MQYALASLVTSALLAGAKGVSKYLFLSPLCLECLLQHQQTCCTFKVLWIVRHSLCDVARTAMCMGTTFPPPLLLPSGRFLPAISGICH